MEYFNYALGRRKISYINIRVTETVSLSSMSWNDGIDRVTQVLQGLSFPDFPQFEDQSQRGRVNVYYRPSDNSLVGANIFRFGNRGSRTPPTQEQEDVLRNYLRSVGIKETTEAELGTKGVWIKLHKKKPTTTMKVRGDVITLEITRDMSDIPLILARDIIAFWQSEKGEYYNRLLRRSPISFSAKPKFKMITERNTFGLRITAPFNSQKTDIDMVKHYLKRSVSDIREASLRRIGNRDQKLFDLERRTQRVRIFELISVSPNDVDRARKRLESSLSTIVANFNWKNTELNNLKLGKIKFRYSEEDNLLSAIATCNLSGGNYAWDRITKHLMAYGFSEIKPKITYSGLGLNMNNFSTIKRADMRRQAIPNYPFMGNFNDEDIVYLMFIKCKVWAETFGELMGQGLPEQIKYHKSFFKAVYNLLVQKDLVPKIPDFEYDHVHDKMQKGNYVKYHPKQIDRYLVKMEDGKWVRVQNEEDFDKVNNDWKVITKYSASYHLSSQGEKILREAMSNSSYKNLYGKLCALKSYLKKAFSKKSASGEYKLGPVSGMVRGLRYGEEDDLEAILAEFDPNEIGERTEPRSYGHFTQKEWGEISDIFYQPRMAKLDSDLARRFGFTIRNLNKVLNKIQLAQKFASKIDTVGESAINKSLEKLKEAEEVRLATTQSDIHFLSRAIERFLPSQRMASDEHLADFYKESDVDGNYMSVQNIKEIQDMANFLAQKVHNGENMEDWVEDKISSARQMLSDLTRYYSNGEKEMKGLDNWKFARKQDSAEGGAEGYFADIPYLRETREFAQSGEDTNDPNIDPKAQKNTPPTPSEIEQDEDVKTLGRVKVKEESVKQDKKATARLLAQWKCLGEE